MRKAEYLNKLHSQSLTDESAILADIKELIKESKIDREEREIRKGLRSKDKKDGKVLTPYGLYDPNAKGEAELKLMKLMSQSLKNGEKKPTTTDITGHDNKRDLTKPLLCHTLGNDHVKKSTSTSRNSHNVSAATDELLRKYAAELRNANPLPLSKDELRVKSSMMPYSTTTKIVDSFLSLDEMMSNHHDTSTSSQSQKVKSDESSNKSNPLVMSSTAPSTPIRAKNDKSSTASRVSMSESRKTDNGSTKDVINKEPGIHPKKNAQTNSNAENNYIVPDLLNLDDGTNPNVNQRLKHVSANRFRKKYPRYCSGIPSFTDEELRKIVPRSDWWIYKFLELCYDEALLAFNTPQSHGKKKIYHGLNVGCLDAFPLLVQRVVGRYYSVLDMKKTISMEILYTVELMIERSEFSRYKTGFDNEKVKFDGGRSVLFSKFLSEEYDVDILALFLLSREVIQQVADHRLKDMTPTRIWVDHQEVKDKKMLKALVTQKVVKATLHKQTKSTTNLNASLNSKINKKENSQSVKSLKSTQIPTFSTEIIEQQETPAESTPKGSNAGLKKTSTLLTKGTSDDGSSELQARMPESKGSYVDKMRHFHARAEKVTPFVLPSKWYFIDDASLPEAPLVAFDRAMLSYICSLIVPDCETSDRYYLVDRVLDVAVIDLLREGSKEEKRDYITQIPVYSFLRAICLEWKKLLAEDKNQLNDYSSQIYESLRSLNTIYDNNCEELRKAEEKVQDAEAALIIMNGTVMKLEKEFKRLEKKWNGNVATPSEIDRLGVVREELAKEKVKRLAAEQALHEIEMAKKKLRHNVEGLWDVAMEKIPAFEGNEKERLKNQISKKKQNDAVWMLFTKHMFRKTVELNNQKFKEFKQSMIKSQALAAEITKTLTIKTLSPEKMKLTLIETLARIVTRNVLNAGKRKAMLRKQLQHQEHLLMIKYNNQEYLKREQERLRREREEHLRKLRQQLTQTLSKSLSLISVQDIISDAKKRAFVALYDPWWMLDLPIEKIVPPHVQRHVENLYVEAVRRKALDHTSFVFRAIRVDWVMKQVHHRYETKMQRLFFLKMIQYKKMVDRTKASVATIHQVAKCFLWKIRNIRYLQYQKHCTALAISKDHQLRKSYRVLQYLRFWRKVCRLKKHYERCQLVIGDRSFLKCFYTWLHEYRKVYFRKLVYSQEQQKKTILIQSIIRMFIAIRFVKRIKRDRILSGLVLRYRSRKRFQAMLDYRRRIECFSYHCIQAKQAYYHQLYSWKLWYRSFEILKGLNKIGHANDHRRYRLRFQKWISFTKYRTNYLSKRAVKIQSVMRMYLVYLHYFNYYKLRRGLIALQSNWRRYRVRKQYIYMIYYYRFARSIQRVGRGWMIRKRLIIKRVEDIHQAAHNNNYDRLKYYVDKFPSLVTRADYQGNTALHNAAYGAAKRTLKLLVREKLFEDVNIMNTAGYTPLHLLITSSAVHRDEMFSYLIERGFDEDMLTLHDQKTCLLLAVEYGRVGIMKRLLDDGHDTNIADANGLTCLQSACLQGDAVMVRALLDNEANPHMIGANGTYPVHDAITGGNIEILNLLLQHNIDVNVIDTVYAQTPLMWACQSGKAEFISQLIIYNADIYYKEPSTGRNCTHYAAMSNNMAVYQALRVADVDFDSTDNEGNTPLHLASYYGADEFAKNLLEGGCFPSFQNNLGDTPAHVAARYNQLELIKLICEFDQQIGKMNYSHQTPLGVAKFYQSFEVIMFLETHYRMVEIVDGRNEVGEIWWDKDIDIQIAEWEMKLEPDGSRWFVNKRTGVTSKTPPALSIDSVQKIAQQAALPMQRNVVMVKEDAQNKNTLTKHQYYLEFHEQKDEIALMSVDYNAATIINKFARRKLAYMALIRSKREKRHRIVLTRFIKRHLPGFMLYRKYFKDHKARAIQACWRGYIFRKKFYAVPDGEYFALRIHLAHRRLRYQLWSVWTMYKRRQRFSKLAQIKKMPLTIADWSITIEKARFPKRIVGVYEEYLFPGTSDIYFYRHNINGSCSFVKPKKLILHDEQEKMEEEQRKKHGATVAQIQLTIKLQALWRAYKIRNYYFFLEKAMEISQFAERKYLDSPERDVNLYNYALYCFVIKQDLDRARHVYLESLRRMQWRGPDVAFVLYSYCIFGLVSGDEEYVDILPMLNRAKKSEFQRVLEVRAKLDREITEKAHALSALAKSKTSSVAVTSDDLMNALNDNLGKELVEKSMANGPKEDEYRYGKCFELANTGFFRFAANTINNGLAWCNYGVCRYIVYNDFPSSFDAFMAAFTQDPNNPIIKRNFDIMMTHFHGPDKNNQDAMVKQRQRYHAQLAADQEEQRRILRDRAKARFLAARTIQLWYKNRKSRRIFLTFISNVQKYIKRQVKLTSREASRVASARPSTIMRTEGSPGFGGRNQSIVSAHSKSPTRSAFR